MAIDNSLPDYDNVDDALARTELNITVAEYHGALSGYLCAQNVQNIDGWLDAVTNAYAVEEDSQLNRDHYDRSSVLAQLYHVTNEQLHDRAFRFHLLLPPDATSMVERADALGDWCDGFLFGLTASGVSDFSNLSEDVNELLRDFAAITQIEKSDDDDNQENEAAFAEITEYVRMGALLIHTELRRQSGGRANTAPAVH